MDQLPQWAPPEPASATAFMQGLAASIDVCRAITIEYTAAVDPAAALSVPDGVAAIGWVRTGDPGVRWRAYVIDVQRGNLVIRTRRLTDGSISEEEFRSFAEGQARVIAELPVN